MKNIKLVIFDLDGTLVNAYPAIVRSFNYVMKKLRLKTKSASFIRRQVGRGDKNLLGPFLNPRDLDLALLLYRRHHKESLIKDSRVFGGVYSLLGYLKKRGYKLAVASNRPTQFSQILIRHLRLKKYFTYVLCADKLKNGKPNPEILKRIMRKIKAAPGNTLYVGDMRLDAEAGRRAGVKTIIVTSGSNSKKEIQPEKPDLIIAKITGLLKLL